MEFLNNVKKLNEDENPIGIFTNLTKGKYLRSLSECLSSKESDCYLFLITKYSFILGDYLDSDFALLKFDKFVNEAPHQAEEITPLKELKEKL